VSVAGAPGPRTDIDRRLRLIGGMASAVREKGFRATTVADVVRHARTSRRTFYEHFADREDCFLALFDTTSAMLLQQIADATDADDPWEQQVEEALDAYLGAVVGEPEISHSYVRELPALGQRGAARSRAVNERFARLLVDLVEAGRARGSGVRPLTLDAAAIVVTGLRDVVAMAIEDGRDVREVRAAAVAVLTGVLRP
jgi:AcrR family transcriptional regulator